MNDSILKIINEPKRHRIWDGTQAVLEAAQNAAESDDRVAISGIRTGNPELDLVINGWEPGRTYCLCGRPGMGKSSAALVWALFSSVAQGIPTAYISLEMPPEELELRALSYESNIPANRIKRGTLTPHEWDDLKHAAERIGTGRLEIVDSAKVHTIEGIIKHATDLIDTLGTRLIIVDHIQLVHTAKRSENRVLELGEITGQLKALALDKGVAVIMLSQLSRNLEYRDDKRPVLADLKSSGAIEENCDCALSLYRDEVYDPATRNAGIGELSILKNRGGRLGSLMLLWCPETTSYLPLYQSYNYESEEPKVKATKSPKQGKEELPF